MNPIQSKTNLLLVWTVILAAMFGAGCLSTDQHQLTTDSTPVQCSASPVSVEDMIINETQNNAKICTRLNSSLTLRLTDWSRTGREWNVTSTPGLGISDEGSVWYDENGAPTNIPGLGRGIHTWTVRMNSSGVQKIQAALQFPGRDISGPGERFDLTIFVN